MCLGATTGYSQSCLWVTGRREKGEREGRKIHRNIPNRIIWARMSVGTKDEKPYSAVFL